MKNLKQLLTAEAKIAEKTEKYLQHLEALRKAEKPVTEEMIRRKVRTNRELDRAIATCFHCMDRKGPTRFSRDNTWIWGGPTPYWGGSMEPDCAVKGAQYFNLKNIVYMYGAVDEPSVRLHKNAKKLLCQLSSISRSPGVVCGSDAENAELLSKLSLRYPNIKGGVIDDLIGNYGRNISLRELTQISSALKKHNAQLKLYSVVYAAELDSPFLKNIDPHVDAVNLWVGLKHQLPSMDLAVEKCRFAFPGKEIMLGIFIYDYFAADQPNGKEILEIQLKRAKKYLSEGKIHDMVILGDREIAKCPEESAFVREFLAKEFQEIQ